MQAESRIDQAAGLRRMHTPHPVRVIAVTSGKGGVGKTNVSVNLSVSMAAAGQRVMLMDADLGLANVDVMLGLRVEANLSHVLEGKHDLKDIIVNGPSDLRIIPAASGITRMAELSTVEHAGIVNAFNDIGNDIDVLVIDTAAGISDSVMRFCLASQDILVVVCDEPASITDAYALIKVLNRDHGQHSFRIIANMVENASAGQQLYDKLRRVTDQYLDVTLKYEGAIPFDGAVRKAVQRQSPVVNSFPGSRAAQAFKKIAQGADKWPVPSKARGHLEFFMERLLENNDYGVEAFL